MVSEIQEIVRNADAFCFDVDSTVIQEEAIDELAKFLNKGEEVSNLTSQAMGGNMTFQESLKLRLDILKPSLTEIKDFLKTRPPTLTPGIRKLVDLLHRHKTPVFLISGGFKCIIAPIACQLQIPFEHIFANRLKFYFSGEFAGFDENEPTSKTGGKAVVINYLKTFYNFKKVVLIGDGATDLEASPPADAFIGKNKTLNQKGYLMSAVYYFNKTILSFVGYGGNVIRSAVKAKAKWFITDFNEIIDIL